jgi:dihydroxyacetone kinase-like predicted kinase
MCKMTFPEKGHFTSIEFRYCSIRFVRKTANSLFEKRENVLGLFGAHLLVAEQTQYRL